MIYSIGNGTVKLSGIILLPLYAKYIPVDQYGMLALFEVFTQLVLTIADMQINRAMVRWYWDKDYVEQRKTMFFNVYGFFLVGASLLLVSLYFLLSIYPQAVLGAELSFNVLISYLINLALKALIYSPLQLLRIQNKAAQNTILNVLGLVITLAFSVYLIAYCGLMLDGVFWAQSFGSILVFLLLIPHIVRNIKIRINYSLIREMLAFSWPLIFSSLSGLILSLGNRFVISYLGSLEDLGKFAIAYKISNIIRVFVLNAFSQAYIHIFFQSANEDNAPVRLQQKSMTYFVYVISFLSLSMILFGKDFLFLFSAANSDYAESYQIIPVLIFGLILNGMFRQANLVLMQYKRTLSISVITVTLAIFSIGLNFLLIPIWGNLGAALSSMISQGLMFFASYFIIIRISDIRYESRKLIVLFLVTGAIYGFSIYAESLSYPLSVLLRLMSLFTFPLILYPFNFYEPIELLRIKQSWRKWRNPLRWKKNILKK